MYCIGIVLGEIVLLLHDFDNFKNDFKKKFIKLIKNLLFHEFENVDEFMSRIKELIEIL